MVRGPIASHSLLTKCMTSARSPLNSSHALKSLTHDISSRRATSRDVSVYVTAKSRTSRSSCTKSVQEISRTSSTLETLIRASFCVSSPFNLLFSSVQPWLIKRQALRRCLRLIRNAKGPAVPPARRCHCLSTLPQFQTPWPRCSVSVAQC
jgi:hypothetical protein